MRKILPLIASLTIASFAGQCYCQKTIDHNKEKWVLESQTQIDSLNMIFESDTTMKNIKNKEAFVKKMEKAFPLKSENRISEKFNNDERSFHQICKTTTTKKESDIVFSKDENGTEIATMKTKRLDNKTILKCKYKVEKD